MSAPLTPAPTILPVSATWSTTPAARALLAAIVASPPTSEWVRSPYLRGREMDSEGTVYDRDDARVAALEMHHNALVTAAMAAGDRPLFAALCKMTVDAAITDARNAADDARALAIAA